MKTKPIRYALVSVHITAAQKKVLLAFQRTSIKSQNRRPARQRLEIAAEVMLQLACCSKPGIFDQLISSLCRYHRLEGVGQDVLINDLTVKTLSEWAQP
jgi:hypothetical protein